jgi:nickel-dependent lactate racemase
MKLRIDYGRDGLEVEVPERTQVLQMAQSPVLERVEEWLAQALRQPLGTPALRELARGRRSACVVISDITRPVPNPVILPPLLAELEEAGIPRERIVILIATGLHRPNEGDELVALVGPEIAGRYGIVNHQARVRDTLVHLGDTSIGAPIWIDRVYVEADLKIATALIEPHLMAGYSGGRKAICPGLMGVDTMRVLHGPQLMAHPRAAEGIIDGNPFHLQSLEVARRAGVDFTVNVAMNARRQITGLFAGDLEQAHAEGVRFAESQASAFVDEPVDVVVTTSAGHPLDLTFYQAVKGLTAVLPIVKQRGTVLLAARCQEGLGGPEFSALLLQTRSPEEFLKRLADPSFFVVDQWQLQELCKVLAKVRVELFSEGMAGCWDGGGLVGLIPSVEEGLARALVRHGQQARIAMVPKGPYVLTRVRGTR